MKSNQELASTRELYVERGWLNPEGRPVVERLGFPSASRSWLLHEEVRPARDRVLKDMADGTAVPLALPCCLGGTEDVLIAEVDRYGLPLRTVLDRKTGLLRSDPYYDDKYLNYFYSEFYRDLYRLPGQSLWGFLRHQLGVGEIAHSLVNKYVHQRSRVLDYGCGMGGSLIPFLLDDHEVIGCDYGRDYLDQGRKLGLKCLRTGGIEAVRDAAPFDVIILSQVLEHQRDPISFLKQFHDVLAEDGKLVLFVPGVRWVRQTYRGDILNYLQNAHCWHFDSSTITAVLARAGFEAIFCDEVIQCVAKQSSVDKSATSASGPSILEELNFLEHEFHRQSYVRNFVKKIKHKIKLARARS